MLAALRQHLRRAPGATPPPSRSPSARPPGVRLDRDTVRAFADAGVHRLFAFSPGFVPRAKIASDLFPAMERFAAEMIGA